MATKKKNQLNIIGEAVLDDNDKVVSKKAIIQPSKEIAPVKKTDGFFKSSDAADNWSLSTGNPMLDFIQRTNAGIWGTVFNAGTNVVRGATSSIEGVGDFAQNRVADIQDLFGFDKAAEKTRRKSEETWGVNKKIDEFNDIMNTTSILGDKSEGVFQGVGSSLLAMGTAGLGGAVSGGSQLISSIASLGTLGVGAAGSSENEARMQMMNEMKDKGYTTKQINDAARMYGLFSGTAETLSEMMFGGISKASKALGIGKGLFDSADDAVINTLTKNIQSKLVKNLVQAGLKASGEGVEEVASGLMDAFAKKLTYMKDEKLIDLIKDENLLDSFISGTLSAYITQAPSAFKSVGLTPSRGFKAYSNNEIRDFITNLNEQEQQVVNREIENRIGQEEKVSKKRRIEIEKQVIEDLDRGYISANTIRDTLGENYNAERDTRLNESFNEEARRSQAYENDLSKYDEKQRKTIQTAIDSGLLNNSNKTHDFVDLIAKLSADKGIDFDFTNNERIKDTGFAVEGKTVNGFIKDGKVTLNLESNQALNKTVGHEITHVLEGTELYDNLQQSLKAYIGEKEWNNRISQLEKVYKNVKGANIQNELTSDLVGEHIFNDENFIRNLSTKNPNLFQKIFDEIKYMVKIATAGSKEARDLEKVKRAFEKAYRETSKTQEGTQYSIKESKKALENQFKELTGDSMLVAEAKLGNYAFQQIQGREVEAPYSKEAMDLYKKIQDSKQTSSHLYHSTPADRIQSIVQNGLQVGSQQNQEGVSSTDKLYLSATEELADSFTPNDSVTLRISPNANLENLDNDLLGGEGSYTITNNIDPKYLQVKENGKWVNLLKSQYAKQNNQNTKYSLTDNQGRQLSEQQQEFFKDSKVRDENGNLKVMYHGTPRGTTTEFRAGTYFTENPKYADRYQNLGASSISTKSVIDNPKTYEVYLDIKNPFDTKNNAEARRIFENEFLYKWGNGTPLTEKGYPDWVEGIDLQEFLETEHPEFDGFIVDEGAEGGYGQPVVDRGISYITMSPEQVKNVDNKAPTSNPDIRYSLSNDEMQNLIKKEERRFNGFTVEQLDKEIGYAINSRDEMTKLSNELTKEYKELQKTDEFMKALQNYDFDSEVMQKANEYADKIRYYDNQRDKYQAQYEAINNLLMGEQKDTRTSQQIIEEAQKHFGTTNNFKEAGYITTDGNMLDFSGFHEGGQKGQRSLDHRQINEIDTDMDSFIGMGNIRILPEGGGINLEVEPTTQQYSKLRDYIDYVNDEVYIDVDKPNGTYDSARYKKGTSATKIINDIKTYFETGSFPQQSEYADFYYSLQRNNEVAPTSGWNVRSEDVRLQSAFKDTIAPLQEQVQELSNTINELKESIPQREYRPLTEQEGEQLAEEYANRDISKELAPVSENLTEEENQRLAVLDLLERNNMLTEEQRYEREQLQSKENPVNVDDEVTVGQSLEDIRDINEVGSPKVKSYQYEHPEVKPYFQQEARGMLSDLNNSQKGERYKVTSNAYDGHIIEQDEWKGVPRFTSPQIAELLDSKWGYTSKDIEKGLNAIIEDHGAENIAVAKRIEFILDDNLRNGYTDWQTGMEIPPNQDYLNMLKQQEWENYFDDINNQYPLEQNIPQYDLENDFSDVRIEPDIQDMTEDDLNLEPFLEGVVKADERQKARQEMDKKVVNRSEYTPKKKGLIGKAIDLYKSATNEFAVVDKFARDVKNPTITHKIDTWNNYVPLAQTNITTAQTDINGNAIGRSVDSIWSEADKLGVREILDEYLKHWSNVDRGKRGKGALDYSAKESYKKVQEIKEQHPEVHRLAKDCWQLYRNARHNLVDAGTISQQQSDAIGRANPHYNPFISENLNAYFTETGELKPRKTIKSAKGGAELEGLLSSEEAMKKYMYSQFAETTGNDAFLEIVKSSPDQFIYGGDDRTSYVNQDHLSVDKDGYYLTAYENGEPVTARISKEMYDSLSRQTKHRVDEFINKYESILKPLEKFGNLRRKMLTELSPSFLLKNPGKDFQEAVINSKYTKDMIANYMNPQTWIELAKGTGEASQFRNLYGSGLVMGQYDIDISKIDPKSKNFNFLKKLGNANEYMELITRYAEFKASRQNGASIQEAMYNAREVTTNFSRGNPIVKAFNKYGMTFLNSSIQGFDKFIRNFSGENGAKGIVNSLAKAAIFGIAPAVFNELVFGSGDDKDEEYEALPDYIKDNYYIIKTGNGNFIRIPKGRVLSVFGSAARRTIEMMEGEENAFEGYLDNVQQQIGINNPEENNIFAPLLQAMGGRKLDSGQTAGSAWYGGDIIPSRLQKERPEDQYDASIDNLSIWLGQHTGISPYKINYVLDQYTGGIGDIVLPWFTPEANSDGNIIAPIKDQFTADTITDNKYVSEFYDTKGKLYTGSKATDEDILKNKYMNSISNEMAKLYAERREVQASDLSKKEKYAKSQEIKAEINRLAKEGMDNYNNVIMSNNYAKIGDTEYYKNANGQWTKVTDDVASLGLDTEEKNEYYKVKNDIYTTKKENDGNDKPLVMQDIINSNLTPDAKVNLYTSNYKDDLIQPLVDSGMDVDSYLTYKSQNFTADKDSNGKSISGSKKRKVFDYINSMNIPYEQKLILAKSEYNSFNDNNYEILEYINNSPMTYEEKMALISNLGFKVDGNNVSW